MTIDSKNTAIIFDIQRFSLHDGPGIRTSIYFKGCPLRCIWCQNPESHKPLPEVGFFFESCKECFQCKAVCPHSAISSESNHRINFEKCDHCGKCASACLYRGIRQIGRIWTVSELVNEIVKDMDYFEDSGGGVTLTGGEPMQQFTFLKTLLPFLKKEGLHINMETCGLFQYENIKPLLPYLDLIYFDLKHLNSEIHKQLTGSRNEQILSNFAALAEVFPNLQARMLIICEMNDDIENIDRTANHLKQHGHQNIHCLPYHKLGESKIARIHTTQKPLNLNSVERSDLEPVKRAFKQRGIHAHIYD